MNKLSATVQFHKMAMVRAIKKTIDPQSNVNSEISAKISRIKLDYGGYDENGTYYGAGMPLFLVVFETEKCSSEHFFRAENYNMARNAIKTFKKEFPNLTVER